MTKKSYNKFVATAATATLVASAIAPVAASADSKQFTDVNERYAPAVDYVVSKGVQGKTSTQFGVQDSIKRVDAAVFIANALDLNKPGSPDAGFSDVPERAKDAVNALKAKGIINGKTDTRYGANDVLTRGEVALILASAYNLKGDADSLKFTDVKKDRYGSAVAGLVEQGVTDGISATKFGTENPVKRGDLAVFLYKLSGETPEVPSTDGITSVKAINDTTVEVKFGKAIDKDFIREAEQNGEYFAVYKYGETIRGAVIQSETVSFSEDGKSAEFVLDGTIQSGERYYVSLLDGPEVKVAKEVHTYGPVELRESAKQPDFEVSAVSDKILIDFSEKMKNTALEVNKYEVYDNGGKAIGDLSTFVKEDDKGTWVNAISKTKVEFTLDPEADQKLRAGETYQIRLKENLETDKNNTLNKDKLVIKVKTPTVKEAAPKVTQARVTDTDKIVLVFDKDVNKVQLENLQNLVDIKTSTGKRVNTMNISGEIGEQANEVVLDLTLADVDKDKLDRGTTYKVSVPANIVNNAVFPNAVNESATDVRAEAQENKAIASLSAKLEADAKDRESADLLLTFDQRPTLKSVEDAVKDGAIVIKDGGDTYQYATGDVVVKYEGSDKSGKTVVIEGVTKTFGDDGNSGDEDLFAPKSNESYTVEVKASSVVVDAFGGEGVANQEKLKATVNGVSVTIPVLDKITLESAEKMVITFKEDIDSTIDLNKISVAGFEADQNKFYSEKNLKGKSYIKGSVSGKTLTLTTAKDGVKFATGNEAGTLTNLVKFEQDAVVSKGSNLSIKEKVVGLGLVTEGKLDGVKFVDNAAPIILFAEESSNKAINFTFSENVNLEGDVAPQFRTGGSAAKSSVGLEGTATNSNNLVSVEFTDAWKDDATDELDVTVDYRTGNTIYIFDKFGNKVKSTKLTGVKAN